MQETSHKVTTDINIRDESFQPDELSTYELYIYGSNDGISCAVADRARKKFIALQAWTESETPSFLNLVRQDSFILSGTGYREVFFGSGFRCNTIVPNPLFDGASVKEQLRLSHSVNDTDELFIDELRQVQAKNIFALPSNYCQLIRSWFPQVQFHHDSTALIEYILSVNRNKPVELVSVNIHHTFFELIITSGKQLLFYNSFDLNNPESLIYFILFTCEQLHLNPESIDLQLMGNIDSSSISYQLLKRYVRNIKFAARPDTYSYSYNFDEVPEHFYYSLFSEVICAS